MLLVDNILFGAGMSTQVGDLIIDMRGTGHEASGDICSLDWLTDAAHLSMTRN